MEEGETAKPSKDSCSMLIACLSFFGLLAGTDASGLFFVIFIWNFIR